MKGTYGMILDVLLRGKSVVSVMKLDILNDSVKPKTGVLRGNTGEFITLQSSQIKAMRTKLTHLVSVILC